MSRVGRRLAGLVKKREHVRAGGGIVWRAGAEGPEILLVHRPKYDDWSLPKGKNEPGEDDLDCALREVEEETGLRCEAGVELPSVSYTDSAGRPKTVRYWVMRPVADIAAGQHEVDEVLWLPLPEAKRQLTYEHDRRLLDQLPPLS